MGALIYAERLGSLCGVCSLCTWTLTCGSMPRQGKNLLILTQVVIKSVHINMVHVSQDLSIYPSDKGKVKYWI